MAGWLRRQADANRSAGADSPVNRAKYREVFKIRSSTAVLVPDRRANSKGWGKFDFAAEQGDFLADNRENRLENREFSA